MTIVAASGKRCGSKFLIGRTPGLRGTAVALPPSTHTIILAPPGTGKTTTLIHALLAWEGGAVVTDPKGEIFEHTAWFRSEVLEQNVQYWSVRAPVAPLPVKNLYGSNIAALEELGRTYASRMGTDSAFINPWTSALKALLLDAEHRGEPPWQAATGVPIADWRAAFKQIAEEADNPARDDARVVLGIIERGERYVASVEGTVVKLHEALRRLAPAFDAPSWPLDLSKSTIYLAFEEGVKGEDATLAVWLLEGLYRMFQQSDLDSDPQGVRWIIDEAGVLRPSLLPDMLRISRGRGAGVVIATQSIADLINAYGEANAQALLGALNGPLAVYDFHRADDETIAYLARVLDPYVRVYRRTGREVNLTRAQAAKDLVIRLRTGVMVPPDSNPVPLQPYPYYKNRHARMRVRKVEQPRKQIRPQGNLQLRPLPHAGGGAKKRDDISLGDF